jgi:transportin-3
MGAEVDPDDDEVLPRIMDLLPSLPDHPKIQYAAILVISRYTLWVDRHPSHIESHLSFIARGFQTGDPEVSAASAMAMKYMCQDCARHLQPFLTQLHEFTASAGASLDQADQQEIWEALGYVIAGMPADAAAPMLRRFVQPVFEEVQVVATAPADAQKSDLQRIGGERLTMILSCWS